MHAFYKTAQNPPPAIISNFVGTNKHAAKNIFTKFIIQSIKNEHTGPCTPLFNTI